MALDSHREDDFVECFMLPLTKDSEDGNKIIETVYSDVCDIIQKTSKGCIWHRDPLKVYKRPCTSNASCTDTPSDLPHIYGICHFGDNIDDEWFVVYILKEITRKIPSLVCKVIDADGEFLLIESANSLPPWASPNNCSNRVYLHRGEILLVNPENYKDIKEISVTDALHRICSSRELHVANSSIQKDISKQIDQFPDKIIQNFHKTTVFTPVGVAALLKEDRSLISAAVHAFCNRDPIDMKVCKAMKYFPPENRVNTCVVFTKSLYAMLMHNNYNPDQRTGWNLPVPNSPQYKSHSLGVKLACGFEILISQANVNSDLANNRAWKDYLQSLKSRNYFEDYLEGSKPYKELLEKAEDYFKNNIDASKIGSQLGNRILNLLREIDLNEQEFRNNEAFLPDDDDDKWLSIDPKDLENMLQERYEKKNFIPLDKDTDSSQFSKKINDFLECHSGVDGVEFPDDKNDPLAQDIPLRPKRGIKKKNMANDSTKKAKDQDKKDIKIDFDADQFSSAIQNILDLVIPDESWDLESGSDVSECGSGDEIETHIHKLATSESKDEDLMKQYMKQMDEELSNTDIAKSFETAGSSHGGTNLEQNALKCFKQSLSEEKGGTGAAGNILGTLGFSKYTMLSSISDDSD